MMRLHHLCTVLLLIIGLFVSLGCNSTQSDTVNFTGSTLKVYELENSHTWALYRRMGDKDQFEIIKLPDDVKTWAEAQRWTWGYLGNRLQDNKLKESSMTVSEKVSK